MIAILDYGLGNLGSIANMLKVIGEKNRITYNMDTIRNAIDCDMKKYNNFTVLDC